MDPARLDIISFDADDVIDTSSGGGKLTYMLVLVHEEGHNRARVAVSAFLASDTPDVLWRTFQLNVLDKVMNIVHPLREIIFGTGEIQYPLDQGELDLE